jgi:WD40-like Beta Propeller Repeat
MRWFCSLIALTAAVAFLTSVRGSQAALEGNVMVSLPNGNNQFSSASGANSYPPSISSDGNVVAYQTLAVVSPRGDTNVVSNILRRDVGQSSSMIVSIASDGTSANGGSYAPAMSADGSLVVFESLASNLVPRDSNNATDIFLRDLTASTTTLISAARDGSAANSSSYRPSFSADGAYVAFCSRASNLAANGQSNGSDLFLWQRATGTLTQVAVAGTSNGPLDGCERTAIDGDGGIVAFAALTGSQSNVYTYDRASGTTTPLTPGAGGSSGMTGVAISADGKRVAFDSTATNLIANDSNRSRDVFLRDLVANSTSRVSVRSDGSQLPADSGTSGVAISADGHVVVFGSTAAEVVPGDSSGREDVFRHDLATGKTTIASVSTSGGPENDSSYAPAVNSDGSVVAFTSLATNIVAGDTNHEPDVFLRGVDFPESVGNSSGPENTGAPASDSTPVTSTGSSGVPTVALVGGGVVALLLVGSWFLLGRRGRA